MKNGITVKNVIQPCGVDTILPLAMVYICYIILHGHLSPGGGFQGGVLIAAVVVLLYFGYGYDITVQALHPSLMRGAEGLAVTIYIVLAMLGTVLGVRFCQNIAYLNGDIGALISSGTISWMDEAVGFNVLTGVIVLCVSMLGVIAAQSADDRK
jgi:multicomponent Na+:H+ antiporter subunit B